MRLSLRDKKVIVNQTLLSELWYIGQVYTSPKYTKTKNIQFPLEQEKIQIPQTPGPTSNGFKSY